ncbi:hypothetical protein EDB81DRAFT_788974 [Dactylonectria macrodidyma]|uniref:Uncharacterized protein n=1 Tax=Dactylonectria macrodidyma TaxID=307937 RepID=A0A9P9FB25_9HYPO|nr:hypothetical protein EDB81DRAFT_788974 [Dactylonectria macrodidyma]
MGALDNIAVRALSQLPEAGGSVPLLTGETTNPNSSTVHPSYTPYSPNFRGAVVWNAKHQPNSNSPEPIEIGSPAYQPKHNYNDIPSATCPVSAESDSTSTFQIPRMPYRPSMLVAFLDAHFPRRSDACGEMLDLGALTSCHLRALHDIFRADSNPADPELRVIAVLEANIHEWATSRQEVTELTKLRFLEFKLRLRLIDLGYNFEAPPIIF